MPDLSPDAQRRRAEIRAHVLDVAPRIAHRRRQKRGAIQGASGLVVLVIVVVPFLTRGPIPTPDPPAPTSVITRVSTDPSIVDRIALTPESSTQLVNLSDDELLEQLWRAPRLRRGSPDVIPRRTR
ncbi:MAG: hypothetical protein ACYTF7_09865 [Planctomycetota bacterium]|jgi:hypothetical protein